MVLSRTFLVFLTPLALSAAAVHFEPNQGQAPADARFVAAGAHCVTLFTADGAAFASSSARIRMTLAGSRSAAPAALDPLPGRSNYVPGPGNIPHFGRLRYRAVYRGIDLLFHGSQGAMEYDFEVAPGADPSSIRLHFDGAASVALDDGSLVVRAEGLDLRHRAPVAYQDVAGTRRMVDVHYRLQGGTVSFALGGYDRALPLTIDPVLTYATYVGGSGADYGAAVAVDSGGAILLAGSSTVASPSGTAILAGMLARIDPTGATVTTTYITGSSDTVLYGLVLDAQGNIIVAGESATAGAIAPSAGAYQTAKAVGFVVKFAAASTKPLFISTFAASPLAVAADSTGSIYVTGAAIAGYPTTTGALQTASAGGIDAFLLKLSSDGTKAVYATYLGGKADDFGRAIAVDASGSVYIAGDTGSSNFPLAQAAQSKFGGLITALGSPNFGDAFVARVDASGSKLLFSTYLGGTAPDVAYGLAIDSAGNAYVTGSTSSADFPATSAAYQAKYAGPAADPTFPFVNGDAFLAKYSGAGALLWSTLLGGSGLDEAAAVTLDGAGNIYIAGTYGSTDFPLTANYIPGCRSTSGPFVAEFDSTGGKLLRSTGIGGMGFDQAAAIVLDSSGRVLIAGDAASEVFFTTSTAAQKVYGGGDSDAYVARIDLAAQPGIFVACVLNAASFEPGNPSFFPLGTVAPGEIVSIFGVGLGPTPAVQYPQVGNGVVTTQLGGTQVYFDNIPAPLLYVGANQINAVVPYGVVATGANPTTKMTIVRGGITYGPVLMPVAAAVPGIFSYDGSGVNQALVLNSDGSLNTPGNPATRGDWITFYAEGAGAMIPATPDGAVAPLVAPYPAPALPVSVTIRGVPAQVLYAGAAPGYVSGVLQINVVVPVSAGFGLDEPLFLKVGTFTSQSQLSVAVK